MFKPKDDYKTHLQKVISKVSKEQLLSPWSLSLRITSLHCNTFSKFLLVFFFLSESYLANIKPSKDSVNTKIEIG